MGIKRPNPLPEFSLGPPEGIERSPDGRRGGERVTIAGMDENPYRSPQTSTKSLEESPLSNTTLPPFAKRFVTLLPIALGIAWSLYGLFVILRNRPPLMGAADERVDAIGKLILGVFFLAGGLWIRRRLHRTYQDTETNVD
jgi:hypothetical protein